MGGMKLESVHCVKDLGGTIASNLKFSQQCKETVGLHKKKFLLQK